MDIKRQKYNKLVRFREPLFVTNPKGSEINSPGAAILREMAAEQAATGQLRSTDVHAIFSLYEKQ
jgi:hypothetical protein